MEEIWKQIDGWKGIYEVSNLGRVRSLGRNVRRWNGTAYCRGRVLKTSDNGAGYKSVMLTDGTKIKKAYVHRLVAQTFLEKPDEMDIVNHKDFDPGNNCANNLEWTTTYGNNRYSFNRGRYQRTLSWRIALKRSLDRKMGKAVIGTCLATGENVFYKALNDCKTDGFKPSCVSNCCNQKATQHRGFKWRFATPEELARMKEER